MASWNFYKDVLPFTVMIAAECTNVVLNILFKAATLKGMIYQVFIVYSYATAMLMLLFPVMFILFRSSSPVLPSLKFPVLCRIFLLAALGYTTVSCLIQSVFKAKWLNHFGCGFLAQLASYQGVASAAPLLKMLLSTKSCCCNIPYLLQTKIALP